MFNSLDYLTYKQNTSALHNLIIKHPLSMLKLFCIILPSVLQRISCCHGTFIKMKSLNMKSFCYHFQLKQFRNKMLKKCKSAMYVSVWGIYTYVFLNVCFPMLN